MPNTTSETPIAETASALEQQACQELLESLLAREPSAVFASLTLVDGRSFAFSAHHKIEHSASPPSPALCSH